MGNLEEEPVLGVRVGTILECLEGLLDTFAKKDVVALADKAVCLQTDDGIRTGFDKDTFFVRSTSTSQPHIVKRVGASFSCDKECLGFVSRKICAHTVAAAAAGHCLLQFTSWFKKSRRGKENLTSLTTFSVNRAARKKKSSQTIRHRSKSPDVMTNMAACKGTLGDAIAQTNKEYAAISTSDLRMTI